MGWLQEPLTEKGLKFNLIFHDSTQNFFFSKHPNKAEFNDMDDSEVLSSDFPGLRTSAASMTSTASTTSMASMTSTASFYQKSNIGWPQQHPTETISVTSKKSKVSQAWKITTEDFRGFQILEFNNLRTLFCCFEKKSFDRTIKTYVEF